MACSESCLGCCDTAGGSAHSPAVLQSVNVCVGGVMTEKETEAQRGLTFPGPSDLLLSLVPTHYLMGAFP